MLAPARHPAADRDLAARVGGPQDAAVVRAQAEPDGRFTDPGHETHLRIAASSPASSTDSWRPAPRAAQRAQRHRARGELVGPDDDGEPGLAAVGEAELGLQRPAAEGTVGGDPRAPQPRRKVAGRGPVDEVDDVHVDRVGHLAEDVFELAGEEHALDAAPEADPRRLLAAERGDELVVAAAAEHDVLRRGKRRRGELEGRARVVVEPPHEELVGRPADAQRAEARGHPPEMGAARRAERVRQPGCPLVQRHAARVLAVEHAQRVRRPAVGVLGAELGLVGGEVDRERQAVGGQTGVVAHRVHLELDPAQPERGEEGGPAGDHLDVEVGVGAADRLHAELVVLAVPPGLGPFVAEGRRRVPDFPRHRRVVLDEGAHDRRCPLRPQREQAVSLVLELVHLFLHDVGADAGAAAEDLPRPR